MIKKVEGIVIKEIDYKETSKILTIFTKNDGIVGVIARGCKRPKSNLLSVTSKFSYGVFHLNYKENLSTLIEVDIINNFKNIKKDITKISYISYITELVNQVYKHEKNSSIYDLYINSILKINDKYDPQIITNILELKLLEYLGIKPILDACAICGSTSNIVTISSNKGGYICNKCLTNEKIVTTKTIKLIRMFYYVDISKISKINISENIKKELNMFIDEYYDQYSGLYLKTKEFINNLEKI